MPDEQSFSEKVLVGLLAMMCADRDERLAAGAPGRKPELILHDAGFSIAEIVRVTGRNYNTVKTIVRRGRSKPPPSGKTSGQQEDKDV